MLISLKNECRVCRHKICCGNEQRNNSIAYLSVDDGVDHNDYVITPNITFIATCNSIKYTGANPIFIDTDENTRQMDLNLLQEFLETETEQRENVCHYKKTGNVFQPSCLFMCWAISAIWIA